jgi:hypothetical protein
MRDPSDRLREIDERARQTQAKINQINFDRSVRAAERGDERRRQQKEFEKFAAGEPLRRTESSDDGAASTDDYPRWVGRIIITGGCPGAAASIWAMIVYWHPPGLLAYAVIIGLGLVAGWIALTLTAWVTMFLYWFSKPLIVIAIVAAIILLIRHRVG